MYIEILLTRIISKITALPNYLITNVNSKTSMHRVRYVVHVERTFRSSDLWLTVTADSYGRTALIMMLRWCQTY